MFGIYQGRKVELEKIMRGDRKKFKIYVISPSTDRIKKVEFGDKNYKIKRDIDSRRKSYRKRHHCDDVSVAKPKDKAEYWSCKTWQKGVSIKDLKKGGLMRNPSRKLYPYIVKANDNEFIVWETTPVRAERKARKDIGNFQGRVSISGNAEYNKTLKKKNPSELLKAGEWTPAHAVRIRKGKLEILR